MSTAAVRWDPFADLNQLRATMDRAFERGFGARIRPVDSEGRRYVPAIDVEERQDALVVTVAVPGIRAEDVEITADKGILTIKGETSREDRSEDSTFLRREVHFGAFERSLRLPETVDTDQATASVANGVLTVSLPRREESRPRAIKVVAADAETPALEPAPSE